MNTICTAAAAVTGARHARAGRNGQDAAAVWTTRATLGAVGGDAAGTRPEVAVVVVCDGCSSASSSEVGARLGAALFARALGTRLAAGAVIHDRAIWEDARAEVVRVLGSLAVQVDDDRERAIHDLFLFTIVAAAASGGDAAVWALGDGAYLTGETTRVLGPFADNQPPYLAYDLLGEAREAHFELAAAGWDTLVVATDGASDLADATGEGLERFTAPRLVTHPDALRRELAVLARAHERIDWDGRRVERRPAVLQDDCAVGIVQRGRAGREAWS